MKKIHTMFVLSMVADAGSIRRRDAIRRSLSAWPFLIDEPSDQLISLCDIALTHDSYVNEVRDRSGETMADNERLEFLGDAVLELVVREHLFFNNTCKEGQLTLMLQGLISNGSLAASLRAAPFDLARLVLTGEGHKDLSDRMLAGAFEAVLGSLFLAMGLETAKHTCLRVIAP